MLFSPLKETTRSLPPPEEETPLQKEIARVGKLLGIAVVIIAVLIVIALLLVGGVSSFDAVVQALLLGVSLAVAAVPEGLPTILTVVLALGVVVTYWRTVTHPYNADTTLVVGLWNILNLRMAGCALGVVADGIDAREDDQPDTDEREPR